MSKKCHGMSGTPIYRRWFHMMQRCYYPKDARYERYGGRGISVCDEWKNPMAFINWALKNGYSPKLTLDRIDYNKNYCPENCRWITNEEQQINKSNNNLIEFNGETHCIAEWSRITGISYKTIYSRKLRGLTPKEILESPVSEYYSNMRAKREGRNA